MKTDYEWIRVIDVHPENNRYLHFEDSIQGVLNLSDHRQPVLEYIGLMEAMSREFFVQPDRVLFGGLGTAALYHAISRWCGKGTRLLTVEASDLVYTLARRFFRLDPAAKVLIGDLRSTLTNMRIPPLDLIFVDCYTATFVPPHLTTLEFAQLLKERLSDNGAAIFNLWSSNCNELCGNQIHTIMDCFGKVALLACREDMNLIVCARKNAWQSWPETVYLKGIPYEVSVYSKDEPSDWPDFMRDNRIIEDHNLAGFFEAIGMAI